mmetsp:Transcript_34850/g.52214  ORF Transcript_34850/g.52214 Transcript_34850/m.52214 type:complete len:115 (+) Transcript_34850:44-388(+)
MIICYNTICTKPHSIDQLLEQRIGNFSIPAPTKIQATGIRHQFWHDKRAQKNQSHHSFSRSIMLYFFYTGLLNTRKGKANAIQIFQHSVGCNNPMHMNASSPKQSSFAAQPLDI